MTFTFSGPMLRFVDYAKNVEVQASDLESALQELFSAHDQLRSVLLDSERNLRRTHQMFLNGELLESFYYTNVEKRRNLALTNNDSVYFLTAIAGG